jgi:hypothetical protein
MSFQQQPQPPGGQKDARSAQSKAQDKADQRDLAQEEMRVLEAGDVPTEREGWPGGPAQYLTYGSEDDQYGTGVTAKLGPADVRHYADGSVSVAGEMVDNPRDYKGEPLIGGPTDPGAES